MKVVKITKRIVSGCFDHHIIVEDDEDIEDAVAESCDVEPSGSAYGFSYKWVIEEDKAVIERILIDAIKNTEDKINILQVRLDKLKQKINQ